MENSLANPLSNPVIGGMVGTLGALLIAAVGYYAYTSTSLLKPDPLASMRSTCEAVFSQRPGFGPANGITPAKFCGCAFEFFYPKFSEQSRDFMRTLYERVEKDAPTSASARFTYDADFMDRLTAVFRADQANSGNAQFLAEFNQFGSKPIAPECDRQK